MTHRNLCIRSIAAAGTLLVLATASAQQAQTGNVLGAVEKPVIKKIRECARHEVAAKGLVEKPGGLSDADETEVLRLLDLSIECLGDAIMAAQAAAANNAKQPSTRADEAVEHLEKARKGDGKAKALLLGGAEDGDVASKISAALLRKSRARCAMKGDPSDPKSAADNLAELVAPDAEEDGTALRFNTNPAVPTGAKKDLGGGRITTPREKTKKPKAKKPPSDRYLAFGAAKGTASGGFAVINLQRDVVGPYQARITAGSFTTDEKRRAELGSAFACFEFDVKGSSPLEFLSVCARPTDGGVQVFASSRAGNLGQAFLADTDLAVLDVIYDGTTFSCRAKKPADADSAFAQFATFTRAQGSSTWTVGIGGAGLGGRAEVGVDDFAIWDITR